MWMPIARDLFSKSSEFCVCPTAIKRHPNPIMKIPTDRRKRGFTLVELLVVIAIIAILASASFIVAAKAIQKAHMATALAVATSIERGVTDFANEYGSVPSVSGDGTTDELFETDKSSGVNLLNILMAKETKDPPDNLRKMVLFNVAAGKKLGSGGTKGIVYNSDDSILGLYDPWGNGYYVVIDCDGDDNDTIDLTKYTTPDPTTKILHKRVAVWSAGADKIVGGKNRTDDFKSW
jgi:prepilin-type N-terminal cleavage/methylation domain-containing protein